ncbi:hypothetical protein B0T10DRAFT_462683 [Thelonectria olida]|uniref:Uncharacterized protein n=1 Tax=Thelonectria olida TaxID=1576542 RepID=A0A9P9AMK8_9HYPO|nr:hypothetical protein B0T10DRAFT_462683 [Thelonectria olida]
MSSPILGDNASPRERPEREQINFKRVRLEEHDTGPPTNTSDLDPTGDRESRGHIVRVGDYAYHQQSPRGEPQSSTGWGPEFFPNSEDPGTPTEMNSPTRYEVFASVPQSEPLRGLSRSPGPTRKPRGRRKSTQPTRKPRRSERNRKKLQLLEKSKRHGDTSRITSGPPVTIRTESGLQYYQEQLRALEEENRRRLASRKSSAQKKNQMS